ncbi:MAG: DNA repair protein RecO [Gudongella sp.]|jgi:DNA repair protein RecO (recombination protein O)|nr:DNA repair protein RecO [Gudongella sp.]
MSKTRGIVLSWMKYKESSKIVNVFTERLGKISILAQGAMKPKSSILAVTEVFSRSDFELRKGRTFYYIDSAQLEDSFYSIRQDIDRLSYGFYALELIEKAVPFEEPSTKLFGLLDAYLKEVCISDNPILQLAAFEIKAISILGYRPFLTSCMNCGNTSSESWSFSIREGGLICAECSVPKDLPLSTGAAKSMNDLLKTRFSDLKELDITEKDLSQIHSVIYQFIIYSLDVYEFKSESMHKKTHDLLNADIDR